MFSGHIKIPIYRILNNKKYQKGQNQKYVNSIQGMKSQSLQIKCLVEIIGNVGCHDEPTPIGYDILSNDGYGDIFIWEKTPCHII